MAGNSPDPWAADFLVNRGRYERVLHIYGDSIPAGYALGMYASNAPANHPLYGLRSIASTLNLVFEENESPWVAGYCGSAMTITDNVITTFPDDIAKRVENGVIQADDVVVMMDAGDHGNDMNRYRDAWIRMRTAAVGKFPITLIMSTVFDYNPRAIPATNYQYDHDFGPGQGTANDAIRAAATADTGAVGSTVLLDMNASMDAYVAAALRQGVNVMHGDGVHPNVWGQSWIAGELALASTARASYSTCESVQAVAAANCKALRYGAKDWSAQKASSFMSAALLR